MADSIILFVALAVVIIFIALGQSQPSEPKQVNIFGWNTAIQVRSKAARGRHPLSLAVALAVVLVYLWWHGRS